MFTKGPITSCNFLKINLKKTIKAFSTLTYITTQLGLKKALILIGMVSQPLRVDIPNSWGISAPETTIETIK
jgi:hypothetical protein